MPQNTPDPREASKARSWSNRLLTASLFGIFFFTLFPYWIDFSHKQAPGRSLFLLSRPLGFDGFLHTSLNTLLFAPFGFALSAVFDRRKNSLLKSLALALIAGVALSYSIEILQLYMPSRDSAWDDVLANTLGAVLGALLGSTSVQLTIRKLSEWERSAERFLSLLRISIIALIYFGGWLVISIPLQEKAHLNNWDPASYLIVGYDAKEATRWSGKVSRVQLWNRSVPADRATRATANAGSLDQLGAEPTRIPLASFDLSQTPPIASSAGSFPILSLRQISTFTGGAHQLKAPNDAAAVLISEAPVTSFVEAVHHTNQVAVLVECTPHRGNDKDSAIFAIASLPGDSAFVLRQEGSNLLINFRNGLDTRKAVLPWIVPDVFSANVQRSILFSYDGARGFLYIDGKRVPKSFYFSPGAALVGELIRIKTDELVAYSALYNSLIFLPIGFLLGLAVRIVPLHNAFYRLGICAGLLLPAILLECELVCISGRNVSLRNLSFSIGLTIAGMAWMNLDPFKTQ